MNLRDKHILLIITGGIAAYKMPLLVRLFIKAGAEVKVVVTAAAQEFVAVKSLAIVSQHPVYTDQYLQTNDADLAHLDLTLWADLIVVAPATANTIAKAAQGLADNLATTAILATTKPVYFFPAMNDQMYQQPATQRNLHQLIADGRQVFEPETGFLAEGYQAKGRLPEPATIFNLVVQTYWRQTQPQPLAGKRVLVTAGGTREAIDPVRYVSNHSSGKMGYALATAAYAAGAEVTLISSVARPLTIPAKVISVTSAAELMAQIQAEFSQQDLLLMAAAPADFRSAQPATQKIKKQAGQTDLTLTLTKNPDILASLPVAHPDQFVAGFAAETENLLTNAQTKLTKKHLDLIIANPVGRQDSGFNVDQNQGTLLFRDGHQVTLPLMTKDLMATEIIKQICAYLKL
ncbi:bifunctional phosphopantothenoylcysteine decarboxylase/phosphopantothenate--cysteine ligase CoaBC [Lapidilactobacillus wuchangensis]|uniref:bifunctional phosphopantothenoylcysteine decarboxylase/phosphopantothenate--cysteine ligase CoaBC n=1 Tax=Lapidilactobacillus wuchangensis TaxID=2486001 RepID=UPI000F772140|nr:bifunctional phosphopantothenoylcysteine decarboxylase/phosphopantothenate--cysteine ligase CoaBC [Lapidilactobacillus wuchangensis]